MGCCSSEPTSEYVDPAPPPPVGFNVPPPSAPMYHHVQQPSPMQHHHQQYQQPLHHVQSLHQPPPPHHSYSTSHHPGADDPGYKWVHRSAGEPLPHTAVSGGRDVDGSEIYVGRSFHEGDMLPAKVIPSKDVAYVAYGGQEVPKHTFEVLCRNDFQWQYCSHGTIPQDAVVAGQTREGEPLYVGRTMHAGAQTVGKVQQSHGCLYIPFGGQEISYKDYEVLVMN